MFGEGLAVRVRNMFENCLLSVKQANRAQVRMCKFDMNATNRKRHDMLVACVCVILCARACVRADLMAVLFMMVSML